MQNIPARVRSCAGIVALALSLAIPVSAAPGERSIGTTAIRIDNFGRVDASLYRGAQPEGRDYADLKALGVKTIVNLTSDDAEQDEKSMTEGAGMSYFQIPMSTHTPPTAAQLSEFLGIVNDPANQPVFVHCVGGRHRTGVMTASYRMTHEGWTADQAFKEMKQYKLRSRHAPPRVQGLRVSLSSGRCGRSRGCGDRWKQAAGGRKQAIGARASGRPPYSRRNRSRRIRDCRRLTCSFCPLLSMATCVPPGITLTFAIRSILASVPRPSRMKAGRVESRLEILQPVGDRVIARRAPW